MANKSKSRSKSKRPPKNRSGKNDEPVAPPEPAPQRRSVYWAAAACLGVAAVASTMLVVGHLDPNALPGCGPGSPCAKVAESWWGTIRLFDLNWPISFIGSSYFIAMLIGWLVSGREIPPPLRWFARYGAVISLMYVAVIFVGQHWCAYCITAHIANLAFVGLAERVGVKREAKPSGAVLVPPAFAIVLAALLIGNRASQGERQERLKESIQQAAEQAYWPDDRTFTGRYRIGPEAARVRIVIFSDYQCELCQQVERYLRQLVRRRTDVSISAKQFPFCVDCNRLARAKNFNPHPLACKAARAAEAVGLMADNDAFWQMHEWLFDTAALASDAQLMAKVRSLGLDPARFTAVMNGREALKPIEDDVEEGIALGLGSTPMVFVNGVELRGWTDARGITSAIDRIIQTAPAAQNADADRPPLARQKLIIDWRDQRARSQMPEDSVERSIGPANAAVHVVMWGDYQERYTSVADRILREAVEERGDVRYTFRHYPANQDCNPVTPRTQHPQACRAARAAEAAGLLGGDDAYWQMHKWLMTNLSDISDGPLLAMVRRMGMDVSTFQDAMNAPEVADAIRRDSFAGGAVNLRLIPTIFINNKYVPRWRLDDDYRLRHIIDVAADE